MASKREQEVAETIQGCGIDRRAALALSSFIVDQERTLAAMSRRIRHLECIHEADGA